MQVIPDASAVQVTYCRKFGDVRDISIPGEFQCGYANEVSDGLSPYRAIDKADVRQDRSRVGIVR
jgi:hypothetical protein